MKKAKSVFKKLLAFSIALAMLMAIGCSGGESEAKKQQTFINSLGGVSETYAGAVSETGYETASSAAEAYVEEQIVGDKDVNIVNVGEGVELSSEQVTALNLPEEISEGVVSVEEIEVEYSENEQVPLLREVAQTKKVKVYVIKYETDWKYFTPLPVTGDTLNKSYYDSIFDADKYKNCTLSQEVIMNMKVKANYDGQNISTTAKVKMTTLIKHAAGKIYVEMTTSMSMMGMDENNTVKMYIEENENSYNGYLCYVKMDDESSWEEGDLYAAGFDSLDSLTPFHDQYLDYTYFKKTDYGCELSKENFQEYIEQALGDNELVGDYLGQGMTIDMFAKYYVSNGVLSGMRMDGTIGMDMTEDGMAMKISIDMQTNVTCTDYGTTVVTNPVQAA